jgi:hypothetical protein
MTPSVSIVPCKQLPSARAPGRNAYFANSLVTKEKVVSAWPRVRELFVGRSPSLRRTRMHQQDARRPSGSQAGCVFLSVRL